MKDELPLDDLEKSLPYLSDIVQKLREKGVKSYSQVFALVRDENADSSLRKSYMLMLHSSHSKVDKRKAVWPLLSALNSKDDDIRRETANTLGSLGNRRATSALIALLEDKSELHQVKLGAVQGLSLMDDPRAYPVVKRIM